MKNKIFALVDCNSFYASCEKIFRPDLKNRPVAVLSNNDGCVVALSSEAKALGIKRGVPLFKIQELVSANDVSVFSSNYELYGDISERVMNTLKTLSPVTEVYSIDEVFLDLSSLTNYDIDKYALYIKNKVYKNTGIPVSVGIGETKTLAKLANHIGKKHKETGGIFNIINYKEREKIFASLDVSSVWGIGFEYTKMLHKNNISSVLDLVNKDDIWLKKKMTIKGLYTVWELRGRSCIELETENFGKKNILSSRSFGKPVASKNELLESIAYHVTISVRELREQNSLASSVIVFIETNFFKKELPQYRNAKNEILCPATDYTPDIIMHAHLALEAIYKSGYEYKKAGVMLAGLIPKRDKQHGLFDSNEMICKKDKIAEAIDGINKTFGKDKIKTFSFNADSSWKMRREFRSPGYTTNWEELPVVKAK